MIFLLQYFPSFAVAFLILACNFNDEDKPILSKKWLTVSYILLAIFIAAFVFLIFGGADSILELTRDESKDVSQLRGHYFCGALIISALQTLRKKFISTTPNKFKQAIDS